MGRYYTDQQLRAIRQLIAEHGHLYYSMGADLEQQYKLLTGDQRSSGALYMAAWRIEKGEYEHRGIVA